MTRRPDRQHRGQRRDGLFWQAADANVDAEPEARDNPRDRTCPYEPCHAKPGHPCTSRAGRLELRDYHPARKEPADDV